MPVNLLAGKKKITTKKKNKEKLGQGPLSLLITEVNIADEKNTLKTSSSYLSDTTTSTIEENHYENETNSTIHYLAKCQPNKVRIFIHDFQHVFLTNNERRKGSMFQENWFDAFYRQFMGCMMQNS